MKLLRIAYTDSATFGILFDGDYPFALTLENPWKDNEVNVSCIPASEYTCRRVNSPTFGDTFEVLDVPGRTYILFHKGNVEDDTEGCILVGEEFGFLNMDRAVLASSRGYTEFMDLHVALDEFPLEVVDSV